jgi:menaquinone-dependent protoporphyrinogen IX oxidase
MMEMVEDPQLPRALVVSGANRSSVFWIVSDIASSLRDAGWLVEIGNAVTGTLPPPPDYDAIVIVTSAWARWRAIARYVEWFRDSLSELPVVIALAGTRIDADMFCAHALKWRPSIALTVENSSRALRSATRVATELIALHARAKLTS